MLTYVEKLRIREEERYRALIKSKEEKKIKGKNAFIKFITFLFLGLIFPPMFIASVIFLLKTMVSAKYFIISFIVLLITGSLYMSIAKSLVAVIIHSLVA